MKVSVSDVRSIPTGGVFVAKLPTPGSCVSARNTVQYVKKVFPRADGKTYTTSIDWLTNTITIKVVDQEP